MKKTLDRVWVLLLLAGLLLGLGRTLLRPKEINFYENRAANQPPHFTWRGWLGGEDQDALEQALSDQVPAAQNLEQAYHKATNGFVWSALRRLMASFPGRYIAFQGVELFDGYITYQTVWLEMRQEALDRKMANYNAAFAAHPELKFYVYYIEKDTDVNFETGVVSEISDYVMWNLLLPAEQKGFFAVRSFDTFRDCFFRTDHHWNYEGADRAYREIMTMLGKTDLLTASGPERIAGGMCGSKALITGATELFSEDFYAYHYDFPEMEVTINGEPAADYGNRDGAFADGDISYGGYYGGDEGEIIFRTQNAGAGNLLILGESYDNALLKLIAAGFENTYSIDLRNYETDMGEPFRFSAYAAAHEIDTVLLIGNMDYFSMDEFLLEDNA